MPTSLNTSCQHIISLNPDVSHSLTLHRLAQITIRKMNELSKNTTGTSLPSESVNRAQVYRDRSTSTSLPPENDMIYKCHQDSQCTEVNTISKCNSFSYRK